MKLKLWENCKIAIKL